MMGNLLPALGDGSSWYGNAWVGVRLHPSGSRAEGQVRSFAITSVRSCIHGGGTDVLREL